MRIYLFQDKKSEVVFLFVLWRDACQLLADSVFQLAALVELLDQAAAQFGETFDKGQVVGLGFGGAHLAAWSQYVAVGGHFG